VKYIKKPNSIIIIELVLFNVYLKYLILNIVFLLKLFLTTALLETIALISIEIADRSILISQTLFQLPVVSASSKLYHEVHF
jgi:hypothetical protein